MSGIKEIKKREASEGSQQSQRGFNTKQSIDRIKKDTTQKDDINIDSRSSMQSTMKIGSKIATMQKFNDTYGQKIDLERSKLRKLEEDIQKKQAEIDEQRKKLVTSKGQKETNEDVTRKIKSLENNLDKQLQKYNQAVARNKLLREQIDTLRRERVVFDNIYKKLEVDLQQKKKAMIEVIEKSEKAYQAREEAKNQMKELKDNAEKEQRTFEKEWNKLGKLIEKDKQKKDFINAQDKSNYEQNEKQQQTKQIKHSIENINELSNEERALRKEVSTLMMSITKDQEAVNSSVAKVQQYEEAFNNIKAATGLNDIDELVKAFVDAEEHNYSLFNYVNELTNEMEQLDSQIAETKNEIEKYKTNGATTENQRKKILTELEEKLKSTESETGVYEEQYLETVRTLNALKIGIQSIFERIGCNTEAVQEMLGSHGVTESNMMQYLGVIEQRTNEILQMYSACQTKAGFESAIMAGQNSQSNQGQMVANPLDKLKIDAPDILNLDSEEEMKSEEDDARALTVKDLKERALKYVERTFEKMSKKHTKKPSSKPGN